MILMLGIKRKCSYSQSLVMFHYTIITINVMFLTFWLLKPYLLIWFVLIKTC